jgi:hypothetical protein
MKKVIIGITVLILLCAKQSLAIDGNQLQEYANSYDRTISGNATPTDYQKGGLFMGYVMGVVDARHGILCPPENVTVGQIAAIVRNYLRDHPEERNTAGIELVVKALMPFFKCKI